MNRRFDPRSYLSFPIRDAATTLSLLVAVLAVARSRKKLPATIERAVGEVQAAHDDLERFVHQRLDAPGGNGEAVQVDRAVDKLWSALRHLLYAWMRLDGSPQEAAATRVHEVLFRDGLRFTRYPFQAQWAEGNARLKRIAADGLDQEIVKLGGAPILERLVSVHREYGQVLGVTVPVDGGARPTAGLDALRGAMDAVRDFAFQVVAHVDESHPSSVELAEVLLAPIDRWKVQVRSPRVESPAPPVAEDPAPTPPVAPR